MQADDAMDLIRFGLHAELGVVIYCASADCPIWRVRVLELDTLPELTSMARRHIADQHTAGRASAPAVVPPVLSVEIVDAQGWLHTHPGPHDCRDHNDAADCDRWCPPHCPSVPLDVVSRETDDDRDRGFSRDRAGRTPRPVPHPSPRDPS